MIAMMMAATLVCTTFTGCGENGSATEPALGAGEPVNDSLTEESKVAEESKVSTPAAPETPAPSPEQSEAPAAETLPGINRNGRYADIPETVLPSSVAANAEFVDEPIYTKPWPDVTGTIYADYMRTQVIKVAEYGVDDCMLIAYCGEDEANGKYGNCIVIYNGQYAIINEVLFAVWVNGIDPEYN